MKIKTQYLITLIFTLINASAFCQITYEWKEASSGGYTYKYVTNDPTNSRFYVLKNGLTVILSPTHKEPRIQSFIAVKAGSKTDPSNHTGLAHYLEHMMFKGTDKYGSLNWEKEKPLLEQIDGLYEAYNSTTDETKRTAIYHQIDSVSGLAAKFAIANEYDKMLTSMGGQNTNAFTSFEQTVYTDDIPSSAVDKYLTLQAERFRLPVFRLFHTELEAVYEEKNRGLDNDGRKSFETLFNALFPNNNYGKQTTIGTIHDLKNPSLKEIRNYYYTYYVPNNMGVIMSGDFDPDEMVKKIDEKFGYMVSKPIPPYTFEPEKPITAPIQRDVYGPTPESLTLAFRFPGASTKDARLLSVVGDMLTNGKAGLFDLDLVKKQKLLRANASNYNLRDYSCLILSGNPIKGQPLDSVKALMLLEIKKLKNGEFADDLLESIANNHKKDNIEQNEGYYARASNLMDNFTAGVDWSNAVSEVADLTKITKAQIVSFANQYFTDNNYVVVYKHTGEDKNVIKVDKPKITPVEVNRDAQSPFVTMINNLPANQIKPVWLDYKSDIQKTKVKNLDLLSIENKDNSLFRLYYRYDMGSWNNKLLPIAANYLQYLGTDKKNADAYSKEFYKLASSYRLSASGEITTVSISGLQENFDKTVALYEDLINNCKPDEQALANLKKRIKKDRENAKLNKGTIMNGLINYAQYGPQNPFNNVLTDEELDAIKADDLIAILHGLLNYQHVILYYGSQTAAQASVQLSNLHKMPITFTPFASAKIFQKVDQSKNTVLFTNFDMVQAEINWIRNSKPYNQEETANVELFNNYFGTGMSSIVFQTLRESKALAYSTYAYYRTPSKKEDKYTLQAYIGAQADKLNEAIKGMNDLLTELPVSDKILISAKENIKKSIETERITQDDILFNYLNAQKHGLDYDIRKSTYEKIDKLGLEDVKAFHTNELKNKAYTYCIVASEKRVTDDDLKKYGDVVKLSLKDIFGY